MSTFDIGLRRGAATDRGVFMRGAILSLEARGVAMKSGLERASIGI
ncbi:MAG: hypothetical protein U0175_11280 [Caldilineaceae bacterium]